MTRVRAPELRGRGWLNTAGKPLTIKGLRGKIVLLDFWTFCCVNCLHVLDELRPLEEAYADVLVVIGVHSPKFEHERDADALAAAVLRHGVAHPVLDDPQLLTWGEYTARAWPTLAVVDPEGYLVATMAGEGHAEGLSRLIDELVAEHGARGTLRRGEGPYQPPPPTPGLLTFPAKAILTPTGTTLVSDSAAHSVVELDNETILRRFGSGTRGRRDGSTGQAQFAEPAGLCLLPAHVAEAVGYHLVVADTVNHLLRGINLDTGEVSTVAGTGRQWRTPSDGKGAFEVDLSSPWDLAWFDGQVVIAMAGIHQLWWFDPRAGTAGVFAGTTVEALRDGPLDQVLMAQPSGLSVSADGRTLWVVDAESSALRYVRDGQMHTAVGQGLFDFGHADGAASDALFQHPLGVCAVPDGSVLVADTYNGAVRRYDPVADTVSTVATGLAEPSDILIAADGSIVVVESAAHQLVALPAAAGVASGSSTPATRLRTERPPTTLSPGVVALDVIFTPAPGQKVDESGGAGIRLDVSASPPELLIEGAGIGAHLSRRLVLSGDVSGGILQVVAQAATCDIDAEHAACHLTRQDWGIPVILDRAGADRLPLILRGLDA